MEGIDASAHSGPGPHDDLPSLLVVVLDTNPAAWSTLHPKLPLPTALAHLILFLNAHLAFSNANRVAVIASHTREATLLYPRTSPSPLTPSPQDANKYRVFRQVEDDVQLSLRELLERTPAADTVTNETMMAGALSLALSYINKLVHVDANDTGVSVPQPGQVGRPDTTTMTARILVVSVSGDLANQYVSVMNSIFAAQRQKVPVDICKIAGDTVFLQQASEATGGVYMQLDHPESLFQYLLSSFMPDSVTRRHLIPPSQINVDFRAACFCHKRVVDIGFVCSICLSSQSSPSSLSPSVEYPKGFSLAASRSIRPVSGKTFRRKLKKRAHTLRSQDSGLYENETSSDFSALWRAREAVMHWALVVFSFHDWTNFGLYERDVWLTDRWLAETYPKNEKWAEMAEAENARVESILAKVKQWEDKHRVAYPYRPESASNSSLTSLDWP